MSAYRVTPSRVFMGTSYCTVMSMDIEGAVACAAICFRETRQIAVKRKIDSHIVLFDLMLRAPCLSRIRLQHDEDMDVSDF
jgi:hypothetical protein